MEHDFQTPGLTRTPPSSPGKKGSAALTLGSGGGRREGNGAFVSGSLLLLGVEIGSPPPPRLFDGRRKQPPGSIVTPLSTCAGRALAAKSWGTPHPQTQMSTQL